MESGSVLPTRTSRDVFLIFFKIFIFFVFGFSTFTIEEKTEKVAKKSSC